MIFRIVSRKTKFTNGFLLYPFALFFVGLLLVWQSQTEQEQWHNLICFGVKYNHI